MNKILWLIVVISIIAIAYFYTTDDNIALAPKNSEEVTFNEKEITLDDSSTKQDAEKVVSELVSPVTTVVESEEKTVPKLSIYDKEGNRIVHYTTYGFTPQTIEIQPGDAIHFINDNILPVWIKAQEHPTKEYFEYASLNQGRSMSMGESYIFTFTKLGTWGYINLNKKSDVGVIIVSK